jgi:hypothetical protein
MSPTTRLTYRRLILEMGQGQADEATIRLAAELAHGLGLDLHGLFIEDQALLHLAALPFAREIRLPSHQWQAIETSRLESELRHAAEAAHHRLRQAVGDLGITAAFEVLRGEPHLCIAGVCTPADIIVMPAIDKALPQGRALLRAVETSGASILLVPPDLVRRSGPVVVVAGGSGDAALPLAARIAEANHERLLVGVPDTGQVSAKPEDRAAGLGIAAERLTFRTADGSQPEDLLRNLGDTRERIIIVTADGASQLGMEGAARISRIRGVPVLMQ